MKEKMWKLREKDRWMKIKSRIESVLKWKDDVDRFGVHDDLLPELMCAIEDLREAYEDSK